MNYVYVFFPLVVAAFLFFFSHFPLSPVFSSLIGFLHWSRLEISLTKWSRSSIFAARSLASWIELSCCCSRTSWLVELKSSVDSIMDLESNRIYPSFSFSYLINTSKQVWCRSPQSWTGTRRSCFPPRPCRWSRGHTWERMFGFRIYKLFIN